jgi:2,3,4,5-tetrahydropyridine-2-carboxylate N-succinyltransferase
VIVEGMLIGREAVIGAGVVLTASTTIIDVTGALPVEHRGRVPPRSVVIPGVRQKKFPAGEYGVPCALIIGQRTPSTDRKVSLNSALRDFAVPV